MVARWKLAQYIADIRVLLGAVERELAAGSPPATAGGTPDSPSDAQEPEPMIPETPPSSPSGQEGSPAEQGSKCAGRVHWADRQAGAKFCRDCGAFLGS